LEILKQIQKLFLFIFLFGISTIGFAQQKEAQRWYQKLDSFLATPSVSNLQKLENDIIQLKSTTQEAQLAQVITYCNLGYYNQNFNRLPQAITYYEKAKSLFFNKHLSGYDIIEYCLKPLGNLYNQTNALTEAENIIKQYLLLAQKHKNQKQQTSALLNLSVVYKSQGENDKAISLLKQAQVFEPQSSLIKLQLIENYIKKRDLKKAESILKKLTIRQPEISNIYLLWAQIDIQKKHFVKAEKQLNKALSIQIKKPNIRARDLAKTYLKLAQIQITRNRYVAALKNITQIYQLLIPSFSNKQLSPKFLQLYAENTLLDALDTQANLFILENNPKKAILLFEKANKVSNLLFAHSTSRRSKIIQQTQRKNRFEKTLTLLYNQYTKSQDTIWLQKALQIDAESKSFVLTQARKFNLFLKQHRSDSLVEQYFLLYSQVERAKNLLEPARQKDFYKSDSLLQRQNNYSRLVTEHRKLIQKIKEKYPDITDQKKYVSVNTIQNKVTHSGETIVSYFFGSEKVFQFIIDQKEIKFNQIATQKRQRDSLYKLCVTFNGFFDNSSTINNHPQEYIEESFKLYSFLKIPVKEKLIIILDGILSFIPFEALVTKTTTSATYNQIPFLVNQSQISYRHSLFDYVQDKKKNMPKTIKVLGVFPEFKNSDKELTYSLLEAKSILKSYKTTLLKDQKASTKEFFKNVSDFEIIHLSTHARGGTFTSPPVIDFIDRELSVNELYGLQLNAQLIVLSACETGVGKLIKGEGVINLARGFNFAGIDNVLFSLWNVNDYSTAWLIGEFYNNLSKKISIQQSITISKRKYLQDSKISNTKKSPFYWASFVYYGEPIIIKPDATPNYWIFLIVIIIASILFFGVKIKKNLPIS